MTVGSDKLRLLRRIPSVRFDEEMRGYSKSQVDRVLETLAPLADEIESLQYQLDDANERLSTANERIHQLEAEERPPSGDQAAIPDDNFDETLRNTLLLAQRTADQTVRDAEANAESLRRESTAKADSIMAGARAEAKELKAEAHAQREQMLADAEAERAQLLADALEHAESRKQAIEDELVADQGAKRDELLAEIAELERARDDLAADVSRFESYLTERRRGVRTALAEISSVLDDPDRLAETETPDPADIGIIEDLTELEVTSHSIGALETEVAAAQQQALDYGEALDGDADDVAPVEESPWDDAEGRLAGTGDEQPADSDDDDVPEPVAEDDTDAGTAGEAGESWAVGTEPFAAPSEEFGTETEPVDPPSEPFDTGAAPFEDRPEVVESDPFATAGFVAEDSSPAGIPASPTAESVFASVPETADPAAYPQYSDLGEDSGVTDPTGLGIDVDSPVPDEATGRSGMSGLAEQARSRLASRVSRLRDTAVPEDAVEEHDDPPPPLVGETTIPPAPEAVDEPPPPPAPPPVAEPSMWTAPPEPPAVEMEPDEWTAAPADEPSRPLHPDARFEELPPDDPFLDELRQMTGGEQASEDETLHKFLTEEADKGESGGWFGRRR